jgi:hypothetical protein
MSIARIETFLARFYADPSACAAFLTNPKAAALAAGFSADEADQLAAIDRTGLALASRSFAAKRAATEASPRRPSLLRRVLGVR